MSVPPIVWLEDDRQPLPPASHALGEASGAPGLLAAGGTLGIARLEEAYRHGIFPWYGPGQPVLWWSPDPRMVLETAAFRLSRSLAKTLRRFLRTPGCEIRFDHGFRAVVEACARTPRVDQDGTWIVPEMIDAYEAWHRAGAAHSVETWIDGVLVGGLYGVRLGAMFFGESMFSHRSDASKIALAALVAHCRAVGIGLVDCQQQTAHLASLGAQPVPRARFLQEIAVRSALDGARDWTYDPADWATLLPVSADAANPA